MCTFFPPPAFGAVFIKALRKAVFKISSSAPSFHLQDRSKHPVYSRKQLSLPYINFPFQAADPFLLLFYLTES